jgi:hypothetical protein
MTVLDSYSVEITENKESSLVRGRESAKCGRWEAPIRRRGLKVNTVRTSRCNRSR